ncbi:hypothetical protein FA10DRAFT_264017 [Acaromyces ingoldii]|uniref:Ankyrin n=1 Tax=Acaromyces ingoldii TaxID=215250 RepID=A0A316YXI9_9BASI|nr:hypothetical protein FA10DRAFT_264017 [Acaromyces ingoldii]PWN93358.1 hypothetical protein FA10DRAFT_264017 [Acaromyces ingoldii]
MSPVAVDTEKDRTAPAATEAQVQAQAQAQASTPVPDGRPADVSALPNEALDFASRMFDLARQGSPDLLHYLSAGLPPNLTNNGGNTLLMLAAYHGHASLVRSMLELDYSGPPPGNGAGADGATTARRHSYASGPDPNQLNGKGQSPLAGAVFKGYDEVARVLVEHGADPLGGTPNADDTAKMFNKWEGEDGYKSLFEGARGRGRGVVEASEAVPDREEAARVPGQGPA